MQVTSRLYKTRLRTLTTTNALAKPDIRTLLVLLVLGFLSAGDVRLKGLVLETKGLLAGAFKGLDEDPEVVVNLVLETVGQELVVERRVGLEARRNMFDEATMIEVRRPSSVLVSVSRARQLTVLHVHSSSSCTTTRSLRTTSLCRRRTRPCRSTASSASSRRGSPTRSPRPLSGAPRARNASCRPSCARSR